LFKLGPARSERPLDDLDIEAWERRRDIQLDPWQADILIDMSKVYLSEMHAVREYSALPSWKPAVGMWRYVQEKKVIQAQETASEVERIAKEMKEANGNRKRR
jgi:hypothetical protein